MRKEIIVAGFGGQGIQSLGRALARALDSKGLPVSLKSNYGPEARGGNSFSQIVIKEAPEDWPEVLTVDTLVALSQEGYDAWISQTSSGAEVLYDNGLVQTRPLANASQYPVAATKVASELGVPLVANMVMLGALGAITRLLSLEELQAVAGKVKQLSDVNLRAVEEGYKMGSQLRD